MQTGASQERYGRAWDVTFAPRAGISALSPFAGQYRSFMVSTGYSLTGATAAVAAGGTLLGSGAVVGVERLATGGVATAADVTGLQPGVAYVARVTAQNAYLAAPAATVAAVSGTPKLSPPAAPLRVRVAVLSSTQLSVWWEPPAQTGGSPVSGYSIQWDVSTAFGPSSFSGQVSYHSTHHVHVLVTPLICRL